MNKRQNEEIKKVERLCNTLAEDIDAMSDAELLVDLKETSEQADDIANRTKVLIDNAIEKVGRRKLEAARAGYEAHQSIRRHNVLQWPVEQKRNLIQHFAQNNDEFDRKLTIAARKGQSTEADIDSFIEDLIELGLINEKGDTK